VVDVTVASTVDRLGTVYALRDVVHYYMYIQSTQKAMACFLLHTPDAVSVPPSLSLERVFTKLYRINHHLHPDHRLRHALSLPFSTIQSKIAHN